MAQVVFAVKHAFPDLRKRLEESKYLGNGCSTEIGEMVVDGWPHLILQDNREGALPAEQFRRCLVDVVADFIINNQAEYYLNDIVNQHYFYFPRHERREIIRFAGSIREREKDGEKEREVIREIYDETEQYLSRHDYLNIHGLILFRLDDWLAYLRNCLDQAVDEFLMEKEYQEFIKLLKYFVQLQEPRVYQVHVTLDELGNLLLLDQNQNQVEGPEQGVPWEYLDDDKDDMLVSTLITVAPQRVVLHRQVYLKFPKATDTLKHVFEKRVVLCKRCKICHDAGDKFHFEKKS